MMTGVKERSPLEGVMTERIHKRDFQGADTGLFFDLHGGYMAFIL